MWKGSARSASDREIHSGGWNIKISDQQFSNHKTACSLFGSGKLNIGVYLEIGL
jgi:hypothetical protein